jgi:hypothetical protein
MLKEVDLRIRFTEQFVTSGAREHLDRLRLQKRLLLCLYALGTNTGLKRMSGGDANENYKDLLYIRRRFLNSAAMRNAIAQAAELSMLSFHLLQISLVYVNTLMIQQVLGGDRWANAMSPDDLRALSPLLYSHVNPYGVFNLDLSMRLPIDNAA